MGCGSRQSAKTQYNKRHPHGYKNPFGCLSVLFWCVEKRHLTQRALADNLHMSVRAIIEIELGRSNPRFKTVALLAKEMNISLDAIVFPDTATATVSKTVTDFFAGKSEAEIQKYISLCQQADAFKTDK